MCVLLCVGAHAWVRMSVLLATTHACVFSGGSVLCMCDVSVSSLDLLSVVK